MKESSYSWDEQLKNSLKQTGGFINICHEALDRHRGSPQENKVALRCISKDWPEKQDAVREMTYRDLISATCQFAQGLRNVQIHKGDKVFALLPRIQELFIVAFGTLRGGAVFCPLFSAFGTEPLQTRLQIGGAKVLISLASYYYKKIAPIRYSLPELKHIILINDLGDSFGEIPSVLDFNEFMANAKTDDILERTAPDDIALLHFTSGTTGKPKGALHVHAAVLYHKISGQMALDLKTDDLFWCTADPGWVTGTSYGIISPLANGLTLVVDELDFRADRWYEILQKFKITVWYTAPTALRMLMRAGPEVARAYDLSKVRFAASVGEPLNPEVILWSKKNLQLSIHDNWWQTETGGIMISNFADMDIRPGSMGKPLPGIKVELVHRNENQPLQVITSPGEKGEIAIQAGWPSMFRGYLGEEERYRKCFRDGFYLSGDLAFKDADGYFWFVGRSDDLIKSAGHLIGPFEVESTLMEHPAVLEAAVIGKPDPIVGEIVKAFIALRKNFVPNEDLLLDILAFARKRLGAVVAPKEISFIESLPKTKSGKIMRRLLKTRELGLPEGDLSMLEQTP
ncbi:MAG: acetate--CoA ligase [Pseudobdellovibrionaceae bacterium]